MEGQAAQEDDRRNPNRRTIFTALFFLALLALGFFADAVRVRLESKEPSALEPVATGVPRLTRRVVLIVLDSIPVRVGTDASVMPNLVELARRGASGVLIAPFETLTTTGVRAMAVGTNPSFRDSLDMFSHREFPYWCVFDDLLARGERVEFHGDHVWTDLLGNRMEAGLRATASKNLFANDEASLASAKRALRSGSSPSFLSLHVDRTDFFAHQFGTDGEEYRRRIREVDAEIRALIDEVDDGDTTVIVTSDHGCDRFGSHGGSGDIYRRVPVIFLGRGIRSFHGFAMAGRQMPLVLAALLGTRLPGGILEPLPDAFLALDESARATLSVANMERLHAIAAFHRVGLAPAVESSTSDARQALRDAVHGDAIRLSKQTALQIVDAVETGSTVDSGMILWVAVLFLAMAVTYLGVVTSVGGQATALLAGCALLVALAATSRARIPVLIALVALLAGLLARAVWSLSTPVRRTGAIAGLSAAAAVVALSAARFVFGGAALMSAAKWPALALVPAAAAALWLVRGRWAPALEALSGAWVWIVPAVVVALGVLQPFDVVPLLLTSVLVLGLRASGRRWATVAWVACAVSMFFLFSQRIAFGWLGERVTSRYLYAAAAGALLLGLAALKLEKRQWWVLAAMACLIPLWPFGYLNVGSGPMGAPARLALVLLPWAGAVALAWGAGVIRWCGLPLLSVAIHRLFPSERGFLASLAVHAGFIAIAALTTMTPRARHLSIAGLMFSLVFLMSSDFDSLSLALLCLAVYLASQASELAPDERSLVLLGAFFLAYVRYGLLNVFGHNGALYYTLGHIDTHAGFVGSTREVMLWWPTTLVLGKMMCTSILAFALVLSSERFRRVDSRFALLALVVVMPLVVEAALELALSFGVNEPRLSTSMVQVVFHAGMVLLLAIGYAGYRALQLRSQEDRPQPLAAR